MLWNVQVFVNLAYLYSVAGIRIQDGRQNVSTDQQFLSTMMKHYMPHGKHLETKRLFRRLGEAFNPEWMSIELPRISNYVPETFNRQTANIQTGLLNSKLDFVLESHAVNLKLSNQSREIVKTFLKAMSNCQIQFEWEDLGRLFWPRYVKSGSCVSGWSCSWPLGMLCQSSEVQNLQILSWRCTRRKRERKYKTNKSDKKSNTTTGSKKQWKGKARGVAGPAGVRLKCRWKKIQYEVKSKCDCSC